MAKVKRSLISVSDKTGIVEFAKKLSSLGVEIISTGGTAKLLSEAGIPVRPVSEVTGFPEMMDGRVKTLHPKIHGGLLALRDNPDHLKDAEENEIGLIDLVVVNLYPFEKTIAKAEVSLEEAIENIDIGGPTMLRSAAKNYRDVGVVTDPADYGQVLKEIENSGELSTETKERLCVKVFRMTADYDATIDRYLSEKLSGERILRLKYTTGQSLRYGENWHQSATLYRDESAGKTCIAQAKQLHGKEMSYNNYVDANAALEAVKELRDGMGVAVIKHTNPCGYATGESLREALEAAWAGDPISAFGSIIAFTRCVDLPTAEFLEDRFVEVVVAPGYEKDALSFLKGKSKSLIVLEVSPLDAGAPQGKAYRHIEGGMLEQDRDVDLFEKWEEVTQRGFPSEKKRLAEFACKAAKHTKSNAIVIAVEYKPGQFHVLGMGAGQPNRVDSLRKLAATKAKENLKLRYEEEGREEAFEEYFRRKMGEAVMASDAFFPFEDNVEYAAENGIRYIVQPGGSVRDKEVIKMADRLGIAMVFTGMRHFLH